MLLNRMHGARARLTAALVLLLAAAAPLGASPLPAWLPRYDVDLDLDLPAHQARVRLQATWTNPHSAPTQQLVFNAHSRYVVPDDQIGFMAKMLEILRMSPSESLGAKSPACDIHKIALASPGPGQAAPRDLPFHYEGDTKTSLVVPLPFAVGPGQSVTVVLDFTMHLAPKYGRWGQWEGVTTLSNWLPVFAFYGDPPAPGQKPEAPAPGQKPEAPAPGQKPEAPAPGQKPEAPGRVPRGEWQPTPFVPWHQPFFNEAGVYRVRVALPCDQQVACTGRVVASTPLGGGRQRLDIEAFGVREWTFLCSARYRVHEGLAAAGPGGSPVRVRVLAFPEHEFYAREIRRIVSEALTTYSRWFGPYPYPDFTIAEAFFGWNGNECSTLVMIDERVFASPHLARGYIDYLVSHETCHQWFYNLIGTNGYCETWMDEAMACAFTHRLLDRKFGRNNEFMSYPAGLEWVPNIRRDDYRSSGMYGTFGRGENGPVVQEMPKFGHLANLFSMCYDKGARVVGLVEERMMSEAAFMDFMHRLTTRYRYRILRVADFQRELEAYTGRSWESFFRDWLYGPGMTDWAVEKVKVAPVQGAECRVRGENEAGKAVGSMRGGLLSRLFGPSSPTLQSALSPPKSFKVTVWLEQKADLDEQTTLGFALPNCEGYPVRIPILPQGRTYRLAEPPTTVEVCPREPGARRRGARVRVEVLLPAEPTQIAVDPDQILVDREPANNFWKTPVRWRLTPLYTFLEETDLTNAWDRWNVICGPWVYGAAYSDAWYTRSTMLGARAGAYRTQQFAGGVYGAYRTDFRDVLAGVDGLWDHLLDGHVQVGFNAERRLAEFYKGDDNAFRAVAWGRYVFLYGSSLYLPPAHYLEAFAAYQDNFLPYPKQPNLLGERFDRTSTAGLHYRLNYLTPYWDPEGGFQFDAWYEGGVADLPEHVGVNKLSGQFSVVKSVPDLSRFLPAVPGVRATAGPVLSWLGDTRLALRVYGGTSAPSRGEFFTMGGGELFRGFDLAQRQGSTVWVGSVEWRVPLATHLSADCFDHVVGLRNVYGAAFYDVGDTYVNNRSVGPVAHAVGAGLRLDVAWFGFVERTMLRVDVAKTVNVDSGVQVWFGIMQPF